ncbi:MAG: L-serine ammonia-lyase, iron-sulfur-dependent, subunit alpha [Bacteroidales bacterium]|nr:L-serine ammonia-lyase, iron-sulfur-dependent, subunit alpha [Bacteroidales bacterium]MCF8403458.1 L-serine ammonia-lyase, iron-sulfur-dependent, subunit alpha [Bacteroidales bacterium]
MADQGLNRLPGIFNDVIGPVMRGPSSSHTAASWRIARICLELLNEPLKKAVVEFDREGVWANNYREQGTVMGIDGGLLGLAVTDPGMKDTEHLLEARGITVHYSITSFQTQHVNTVRITLHGLTGNKIVVLGASLGGGLIKIYKINEFNVDIRGDIFELLLITKNPDPLLEKIKGIISPIASLSQSMDLNNKVLVNIKSPEEISLEAIDQLRLDQGVQKVMMASPILPVVAGKSSKLPFTTLDSLRAYAEKGKYNLGEMGLIYEKCLSGLSESALFHKMEEIVSIIDNSIVTGLAGTNYKDRILPHQSHLIRQAEKKGNILKGSIVNTIISNVTAIMESKSAMEVFVANPTAGSCGTVGGVLKALAEEMNSTNDEIIKAYFAAGLVGVYFAAGPGFSAEEHGCQVECGAASGMAAAAITQLLGGSAGQALDAASMAIQNMLGLICDPVADRVEVPCLGKNVMAALNAYASATMVCSGFDAVIPLEEVIQTVAEVSKKMPVCVKCTGKGGLAITKTSLDIKSHLMG